ncbi:hypothetical protein [Phycicoccus sonneratiae]|uniref:ABC transmembrane type-1 domain-containing protein n=1 Tax=Phycicoccus sonneratiae TaxID=2807628 RepID=A0ABS2CKX2_9MICO|nr:hypothetical protein [Phycicoccus sonneraticus]MBM6400535.1 hypothetical protein [Phycicoccus sonneraticus]
MGSLGVAVGSAVAVLRDALRIALGHWPVLAAIALVGVAGHNGFLWLCVWLSADHGLLAAVLLPLVPISSLVALVLMLRYAGQHEPTLATLVEPHPGSRLQGRLVLLASTLLPFLTLYVSQDQLEQDRREFVNTTTADEFLNASFWNPDIDTERALLVSGAGLFALVAVAFVLRTALDRFRLPARHLTFGLAAAYVEVLWVFLLAGQVSRYKGEAGAWLLDRQLTTWALERWQDLTGLLGPLTEPVRALGQRVADLLANADQTVVLPIAWLTVGAVVFGQELVAPDRAARASRWRHRSPSWVTRGVDEATASVRDRFGALARGVRLLTVAGLVPMLMFCVAFLLAEQVGVGVDVLVRAVVGPREGTTAIFLSPILSILGDVARSVALVALLTAALGRVVGGLRAGDRVVAPDQGPVVPAAAAPAGSGHSAN